MGRAISLVGAFMAGVRVAGDLTYIPAHIKNGKKINSRCIIPVYANSNKGTDTKTGEKGRSDQFRLVAWGKLADTCCRSLPKGKAIDLFSQPHQYMGKVYNVDGTLRLDTAGMVIETSKVAFTILNIVFGEESDKIIAEEIATGRRPINWKVQGHPEFVWWTQHLHDRQAAVWDGRSQKFGFARVVVPQGTGIQLDFSQQATPANVGAAFGNPTQTAGKSVEQLVAEALAKLQSPPSQAFTPSNPATPAFMPAAAGSKILF